MAAEPVGTAYVIIRAITNQLGKDIKDGLDKGSKDADTDAAGRELGRSVGESAGDEFGDTWNEESSRSIRESADSTETRRAQDDYASSFFDRFKEHFRRGGDDMNASFREGFDEGTDDDAFRRSGDEMSLAFRRGFEENVGDGDFFDDVGDDSTFGHDLALQHAKDYRLTWNREQEHTFTSTDNDDSLRRGMSGALLRAGTGVAEGAGAGMAAGVAQGFAKNFGSELSNIMGQFASIGDIPGGGFTAIGAQIAMTLVGPGLQVVGALAGELVAVLGFIGTAAMGAGVALAGVAAAALPAFFAVKSAFSVDTPLLDEFKDRASEFSEAWEDFGAATQELLLPSLMNSMDSLEKLIPIFAEYGHNIGDIIGYHAEVAAATLTTGENQDHLRQILEQGSEVVDKILGAGVNLITPLMTILDGAMPIANMLADDIGRLVQGFSDWVNMKGADGLTELFGKWYERFQLLMSIVGNLGGVLADVFGLGADEADGMFETLDKITERWAEWTNSATGQNTIANFFENARRIGGEVFGLLGDIIKLIMGPMADIGGAGGASATDNIVGFFQELRHTWLPGLVSLGTQAYNALKGPISDLFGALKDLFKVIVENPDIVKGFFSIIFANFWIFTEAVKLVTKFLNTGWGKALTKWVLKFLLFLKIVGIFFGLASKVWGIISGVFGILSSIGGFLTSGPVLVIMAIIGAFLLLYFHLKPFRDFVDKYIIDPLQRLWQSIEDVGGLGHLLTTFPALVRIFLDDMPDIGAIWKEKGWAGIGEMLHGVADDLRNTFEGIPLFEPIANGLAAGFDTLGKVFDNMPQWKENIKQWGTNVKNFILNLPSSVPTFFVNLGGALWDFITNDPFGKIGEKLHQFADWLHTLFNDVPVVGRVFDILAMIVSGLGDAFEWLSLAIGNTVDWFSKLPTTVPAFFTGLWDSIWGFLSEDPLGKMQTAFDNVGTTLSGLFDNIPVVSTIFDGLGAAFRGLADAAGGVKDFFSGLTPAGFLEKAGNAGDMLAGWLGTGLQFLIDHLPEWGTKIGNALGTAFRVAGPIVLKAIGGYVLLILGELRLLAPIVLEILRNLPALLWSAIRMWGNVVMGFLRSSGIADVFNKYWHGVVEAIIRFFVALPGVIAGLLGRLGSFIASHLDEAFGFLVNLGQIIGDAFGTFLDFVISNLPQLGKLLGKGLGLAVKFAAKMFIKAIPFLIKAIPTLLKLIVAGLAALPALLAGVFVLIGPLIWEHIKRIPALTLAILKGIWNFIVGFFEGLGIADEISEIFFAALGAIVGFFKDLPGHILDALGFLWDTVIGFFLDLWDMLVGHSIIPDMIMAIVDWFLRLPGMIFDAIMGGLSWLLEAGLSLAKSLWDGIVNFLTDTLPTLIGKIPGWLGTAFSKLLEWGTSLARKIWEGITFFLTDIVPTLLGWIITWLGNAFGKILEWGTSLARKVWEGITFFLTDIVPTLVTWIVTWLGNAFTTILGWGTSLARKIWEGITFFLTDIVPTLVGWIVSWLGTAFGTILGWGADLARKIWEGITHFLTDIVPTLVGWIFTWLGNAFGTVLGWGTSLARKIWEGITQWLEDIVPSLMGHIATWLRTGWDVVTAVGKSVAGWIWNGLSGLFKEYVIGLPGKIVDWITGGLSKLEELGEQILAHIILGIGGAISHVPGLTGFLEWLPGDASDVGKWEDWANEKLHPGMAAAAEVGAWTWNRHFMDNWFDQNTQRQLEEQSSMTADQATESFWNTIKDVQFTAGDLGSMGYDEFADMLVSGFGDTGTAAAQELSSKISAALADDGLISDAEMPDIIAAFYAGIASGDFSIAGKTISDGVTEGAIAGFKGKGAEIGGALTPEMDAMVTAAADATIAAVEEHPLMPEKLLLGASTAAAETWWGGFTKSSEKTTGKKTLFQKTATNVTSGLSGEIGKKDADMVAPTNRLVDKILLTLARLVKEVKPKVINPFIMEVVDGINTAATQALSATNSLVNRVLLTMARLGNEVQRPMNVFILNVVVGMNSAATQATSAANRLVNQVIAAMGSLAGRMINILAPAGVNAATGLTNGFKLGLGAFISLLSTVDNIAVDAVGNLNGVLVSAGQALINGMIMGMASRMGELRRQAQEAARLAAAAANPVSSALPWHAANGGIFSRPTYTLIGEAGREAVIPLTRPMRAMSVMRAAGLDTMLAANSPAAATASANPLGGATDLSILRIDHAEIFDKVDVDIIAAQIRRAYMSLPGH